jgi:hypothetical protein
MILSQWKIISDAYKKYGSPAIYKRNEIVEAFEFGKGSFSEFSLFFRSDGSLQAREYYERNSLRNHRPIEEGPAVEVFKPNGDLHYVKYYLNGVFLGWSKHEAEQIIKRTSNLH